MTPWASMYLYFYISLWYVFKFVKIIAPYCKGLSITPISTLITSLTSCVRVMKTGCNYNSY